MECDRRAFLKMSVAHGAAASLDLKYFWPAARVEGSESAAGEVVVRSTCSPNCTGACGFNVHVVNGRISTLIQSADYPEAG